MRSVSQVAETQAGFAEFASCSLRRSRSDDGPCRSDVWPCPPPFWRRWTGTAALSPRRRRRLRFLETKAKCLQSIVITLNWLSLGHAKSPPEYARVGYPFSESQHQTLERLEDLVDYFLSEGGGIPFADLGRAGEKLSKLGAASFGLESVSGLRDDDISSFLILHSEEFRLFQSS